jgi:hypothetical protein
LGCSHGCTSYGFSSGGNDDIYIELNKFSREVRKTVGLSLCGSALNGDIASFNVGEFAKTLSERLERRDGS